MNFDCQKSYRITCDGFSHPVTHTLKQPSQSNIHEFEKKKLGHMKVKNNEIVQQSNVNKAYAWLWDLLAESVEGYPFDSQKNWREKVPVLHKVATVRVFGQVEILTQEEVIQEFGQSAVTAESYDSIVIYMAAQQEGERILLTHVFKQPGVNDLDEFESISSSSKMRLKQNAVNINFLPTNERFCGLYDRLIQQVHGYECDEKTQVDEILEFLPPLHKEVAVKRVFSAMNEFINQVAGN